MFSPNIKRYIACFINLIFTYIVAEPILFGENGYFICSAHCALDKCKKKEEKQLNLNCKF